MIFLIFGGFRAVGFGGVSGSVVLYVIFYIYYNRPSKSDSAPVRVDSYEPAGLRIQQSHAETSHSVRVGPGGY